MNGYIVAGLLVLSVMAALLAYHQGYGNGYAIAQSHAVQATNAAIQQAQSKAKKHLEAANQKAIALRAAQTKREYAHEQATAKLRRTIAQLKATHQCLDAQLPAGLVRQLTVARDHAAQRAATGAADAAVPGTTKTDGGRPDQ